MLPTDMLSYVKKKVLSAPESAVPSRPRPKPKVKTRSSALNSASVRQRYGLSEASYQAHRAASAERRKSTIYGDSAALSAIRNTFATGVKTATDTVNKLSVPGESENDPTTSPKSPNLGGRRGSAVNLLTSNSSTSWKVKEMESTSTNGVVTSKVEAEKPAEPNLPDGGKSKTSSDARCKVCFKKLALNEYFKVCCTCKQKVCDDCSASYGPKEAMAVEATFKCSICLRQIKHISEDGNRRVGLYNLKSAGMAVVAQNRFKSSGMSASKRQDSFHFEGKQAVLSLPEQQVRRHSIGNVPGMSINIAALQPKMEKKPPAASAAQSSFGNQQSKGRALSGSGEDTSPAGKRENNTDTSRKGSFTTVTSTTATTAAASYQSSHKITSQQRIASASSYLENTNVGGGGGNNAVVSSEESGTRKNSNCNANGSSQNLMLAAASGSATGASNLKVQQAPSADHQASWMRAQQLSGDGIQIMVNDVDLGQGGKQKEPAKRGGGRRKLTLYNQEMSTFGLQVKGQMEGNLTVGRIQWMLPGGPAQMAGLRLGDKILEWDGLSLSTVPIEDIPEFVEDTEGQTVNVVILSEEPNGNETSGRRRLPSVPNRSPRGSITLQARGWIQLALCFEDTSLVVTLWSAEGLKMMETAKTMALPKPYALVRLCIYGCNRSFSTQVENATQNPVWAAKHVFPNIAHQDFPDVQLDVTVWNFSHNLQHECIGKATIDPKNVNLDGAMQWWPITAIDHAVNGSNEGSQQSSPQHQASQAPAQVAQNFKQRSPSHSQADLLSGSGISNHLMLDMNQDPRNKMRRKSDCSGLMAFQLQQQQRHAPACGQQTFDPLSQRPKRNRSLDRSNDQLQIHRNPGLGGSHYGLNRPSQSHLFGSTSHLNIQLGPLQMYPRYSDEFAHCGELKLGFFLSDDYLEVEIVSARELPNAETGCPDTYVTTQLMEEDRRFLTRRTGIVRQLSNPIYRQTIKYLASDVSRRRLVATVWSLPPPEIKYDSGGHHVVEECIGLAQINIDKLMTRQLLVGWYKLFPPFQQ